MVSISAGTATTVYDDSPHFDLSNFPSRGSSYHVNSGGWVVYAEPNYQGKCMIHVGGKISLDGSIPSICTVAVQVNVSAMTQ